MSKGPPFLSLMEVFNQSHKGNPRPTGCTGTSTPTSTDLTSDHVFGKWKMVSRSVGSNGGISASHQKYPSSNPADRKYAKIPRIPPTPTGLVRGDGIALKRPPAGKHVLAACPV